MTPYEKMICILLTLGFLLFFGGSVAFEAKVPILGAILGGDFLCVEGTCFLL